MADEPAFTAFLAAMDFDNVVRNTVVLQRIQTVPDYGQGN
jgi:hypothetical protein